MRSIVIVCSYHHQNTEKVARAIAQALDAEVIAPQQVRADGLKGYDLIGFGSGIYDSRPHRDLLDLVDGLPPVSGGNAFIFSTNGSPGLVQTSVERDRRTGEELEPYSTRVHIPLRGSLLSKGYSIIGEFSCPGLNTNSFLRLFGGINKGRPSAEDLRRAEAFARGLKEKLR